MSCASLDRIMFARRTPISQGPIQKKFFPVTKEGDQARNPQQFYRDVFGTEKKLNYNHQPIFAKFRKEFTDIQKLESDQKKHFDNQNKYDEIQETIDTQTSSLKDKIKTDFEHFLTTRLGPNRKHLIPEITHRFSQKAFTTFISEVNDYTTKEYQGIITDESAKKEYCILHIPPQGPVQIEATTEATYQNFIPVNGEKKPCNIPLKGHAIYTIGLDGRTLANISFSLSGLPETGLRLVEKVKNLFGTVCNLFRRA
jgi:hypothetical protein